MAACTYDSRGAQYILGVWGEEHLGDYEKRWRFLRHRFQLTSNNGDDNNVVGQYITSNWFSHIYKSDEEQEYLVMGVKGNFQYSTLAALANGARICRGRDKLTVIESDQGVIFKEHFVISPEECEKIHNNNVPDMERIFNILIKGKYSNSELSFSSRIMGKGIYMTLPTFQRTLIKKSKVITT